MGGANISRDRALSHVFGYTVLNDITARDLQFAHKQWFRGKSFDTYAPLGPWVATPDEIDDPHNLDLSLDVNGKRMQTGNTSSIIFRIPKLIEFISRNITLDPGDIISTGTPPGVGAFKTPPQFLRAGDSVTITVSNLGTQQAKVIAEPT